MFFKKAIFRYIKSFGFYRGLIVFFKVRRSAEAIVSFYISGLPHPIFLRRHTSDFVVFEEMFIDQQYRTNIPKSAVKTIIDAGANIGLSALYLLRKFPSATIICLEPEDTNFELLQQNLRNYQNAVLLKKGLWHSKQYLSFINTQAEKWAFEIKAATAGEHDIAGVSINDLMIEYHLENIDLLKMDIEGSEKEVFEQNTEWTDKVTYIIVEIHEDMRPGAYNAVKKLTDSHNFTCTQQGAQYFFTPVNA